MTKQLAKDILSVVEYLYHDERFNFEGEEDHIFRPVYRLNAWLRDNGYKYYDDDIPLAKLTRERVEEAQFKA
jgi:hypothetical protein